ncbi:hypothetical protein [Sphaerisporangium corydalis]|uniref:Uncharacterized protein n=1 Tax=Sphaerisporangium corydalis TaxID=1441875 RepID=A0ABV9EB99_9ACTN|nr:hypothetical protein [Sphaerisporangium corydalis]
MPFHTFAPQDPSQAYVPQEPPSRGFGPREPTRVYPPEEVSSPLFGPQEPSAPPSRAGSHRPPKGPARRTGRTVVIVAGVVLVCGLAWWFLAGLNVGGAGDAASRETVAASEDAAVAGGLDGDVPPPPPVSSLAGSDSQTGDPAASGPAGDPADGLTQGDRAEGDQAEGDQGDGDPADGDQAEGDPDEGDQAGAEPSAAPASGRAAEQATAIDGLLSDSTDARSGLGKAIADVSKCDRAGEAVIRRITASRSGQLTQARSLEVDALTGGAALKRSLVEALDASQKADAAFLSWASRRLAGGCRGAITDDPDYGTGLARSEDAKAAKLRFVEAWRPIAAAHDLTARRGDQI